MKIFAVLLFFGWLLGSAGAVSGQGTGFSAGQSSGTHVVHPATLRFYCTPANTQCQQLDADGDGVVDFDLLVQYGGSIYTLARSLFPAAWQVLADSTGAPAAYAPAAPLPYGEPIGPRTARRTWTGEGQLVQVTTYAGQFRESGNWAQDTLTRYLGIRQWQGGAWRYGYLQTRRQAATPLSPIYVTAYAMQTVVTATAPPSLAGFEAYPNPASDVLTVGLPALAAAEVQLRDLTGWSVYRQVVSQQRTVRVPLAGLPPGIYLVQLQTAAGIATRRIAKE
ncbi:hypothetical protein AUC43_17340 [Hymenobacter sedentarius]|uniref:Secretion system C-terminal sorting domain-containing protein n=1 Tax=Hymenobacter sedentarius TaxID=1411621 RepID=A0A0U4C1Z9_9BACT|nr:T9SS type A sorting domain-containing protein [Hymenobacter sedentarius]ALW86689.1 hypothetical protein AUC43_17340 [Hymenobacter sedentarius]